MARSCVAAPFVAVLLLAAGTSAFDFYQSTFPNGASVTRNGNAHAGVGHNSAGGGGALNPFGTAYVSAGRTWTTALCQADSDGDGFTNGQELGDPDCVWTTGATPARTTDITHPGFADSTPTTAAPTTTTTTTTTTAAPTTTGANGETPPPTTTTTTTTTTTPAPTTAAPTPPPPTLGATSPIRTTTPYSSLDGNLDVSWALYENADGFADNSIDITLSFAASGYGALGVSARKMSGPMIVATVDQATGFGSCLLVEGYEWGVRQLRHRGPPPLNVTARIASGRATVTCRVLAASMGIASDDSEQRVIVAVGRKAGPGPSQHGHGDDDRAAGRANWVTGELSTGRYLGNSVIGIIIVLVLMLGWLLVGVVLYVSDALISRTVNIVFHVATAIVFLATVIITLLTAYFDARKSGHSAPTAIAFGFAATHAYMWSLYPVPKRFGVPTIVGSSFERCVPLHVACGVTSLLLVTLHLIFMQKDYLEKASDMWSADTHTYKPVPLTGSIAWLLTVILVLSSFVLRRVNYAAFRVLHFLFFPIIVFGMIHAGLGMIIRCIIPLIIWLVDVILRVVSNCRYGAVVEEARALPGAKVTCVKIRLQGGSPPPQAGQFAMMTFGEALVPHPFSVAWYDRGEHCVHMYIKALGRYTTRLHEVAAAGQLNGRSAGLTGFYGTLQVAPAKVERMLLVAGGIGVTPMLSMLGAATDAANPNWTAATEVHLLFICREPELIQALLPHFAQATAASGSRKVEICIYYTSSAALPDLQLPQGVTVSTGRPDIKAEVVGAWKGFAGPVGVYCCGPAPLMDATVEGSGQRAGATYVHTETFEM